MTTITITDDFTGVTRADFVAAFNASDAGALFTAAPGSGTSEIDNKPVDVDNAADEAADATLGEVDGSADVTVVVTFDVLVDNAGIPAGGAAPELEIWSNVNPIGGASIVGLSAGDFTATPTTYPVAGATVVTYSIDNSDVVPGAFASARYAIGEVFAESNSFANTAQLIKALS
jgi:hypothetical protein